jgi:hypothetical protein
VAQGIPDCGHTLLLMREFCIVFHNQLTTFSLKNSPTRETSKVVVSASGKYGCQIGLEDISYDQDEVHFGSQ